MGDDRLKELQRQLLKLQGSVNALAGEQETILFKDFAATHLANKLANPTLREATKRSFEHSVRMHLVPAFGLLPLERINNTEWLQWVTDMRRAVALKPQGERAITRFFNVRKALLELLNAAKEGGILERVPRLDNPDEPRSVGRALSDREILSILWKARRPFRFIFYTFWRMGCRPREILKWEWDMIRFNEPGHTWIDIPARISKTDRNRSIPICPDVSKVLYRRKRLGDFVFPDKKSIRPRLQYHCQWNRACRDAGVQAVAYDLRRTFITRCAAENRPLLYVAKMLDTSTKMIESTYAKAQADVMEGIVR